MTGPRPELEIGADVDVTAIMAEVTEEVRRKREAGEYPPDVLVELEVPGANGSGSATGSGPGATDRLRPALADLQRSSRFTALVTTASHKPVIAPLITAGRRALRASLTWYMNGILEQVSRFADNTVRATGLLAEKAVRLDDRVSALEARVPPLEKRADTLEQDGRDHAAEHAGDLADHLTRLDRSVRDLRAKLDDAVRSGPSPAPVSPEGPAAGRPGDWSWAAERSFDYLQFEDRFRGSLEEIADRQRMYVDLFRGATAPVVDLGCGRGEFLGLLKEADIPSYGIDRHFDMVDVCRQKGLDVREADSLEYLAAAEPGSLGGVFCAQMIEHLKPSEVPGFFELAAAALAPGAPLVVETINPESLFVFAHAFYVDLGHLRPLHPLTLEFLANEAGFSTVKVEYLSPVPPEFRPQLLPGAKDEPLATLVASIDENFRRVDDILFGPQDFAVVAHR
jgi:SAM-dependent methyltransferase